MQVKKFPLFIFFSMNNSLFSRRNSKKLLREEKNIALKRSRFHRETPQYFAAENRFSRRNIAAFRGEIEIVSAQYFFRGERKVECSLEQVDLFALILRVSP